MMERIPIIFAPGMMCDGRLFKPQASRFGPERGVQIADFNRGETIADYAAALLANAPPRFALAGLSMGGVVAFEVWRRAPQRIAGLAFLNTTPLADSPARSDVRRSQIERVRGGQLRTVVLEELKPNYLGAKTKRDQTALDAIAGMALDLGAEVFVRQTRALMARVDSVDTLATIDAPTIVVAGAEDEVCPPELHEIIAGAIPNAELTVLPECGHLSTIEAPEAVNKLLTELFARIDA